MVSHTSSNSGDTQSADRDGSGRRAGTSAALSNSPPGPTSRSRLAAWGISLAVHAVLVVALLVGIESKPPQAPPDPDRLVFLEPAPPPPPPAGGADGSGDAGDRTAAEPQPADRLVEVRRELRPTTRPTLPPTPPIQADRPRRRQQEPQQPPRAEDTASAGAVAGGVAGGDANGVIGGELAGVPGGVVGGTIGGAGDAVVRAEVAAKPPMILERVLPEYPSAARARRVEGLVVLRAVVDKAGNIEDEVIVIASVPPLDDAAVTALRQWKFTPGRDAGGAPVRVQIDMPIRFKLP